MKVSVDLDALAEAARLEALAHEPRTPERRTAAALYTALTETRTLSAAKTALSGFAAPDTVSAALELLGRLAAEAAR